MEDRFVDVILILAVAALIILKATGIITWSWFAIFSPLIFLLGFGIILAVVLILACLIRIWLERRKEK